MEANHSIDKCMKLEGGGGRNERKALVVSRNVAERHNQNRSGSGLDNYSAKCSKTRVDPTMWIPTMAPSGVFLVQSARRHVPQTCNSPSDLYFRGPD